MQTPPAITDVLVNHEVLGFHLEDGRFISVPVAFYPTLALATDQERERFEISGSSVDWPELEADIGVKRLLAGAREHHHYARKPWNVPSGWDDCPRLLWKKRRKRRSRPHGGKL